MSISNTSTKTFRHATQKHLNKSGGRKKVQLILPDHVEEELFGRHVRSDSLILLLL